MEKHIDIPILTPYFTLNEFSDKTRNIWLVCHGQGQLAEYFIKKWQVLNSEENFVIAPQGISKYYLNGFTGRVGASWMTKEDRLTEIANQQELLKSIWDAEIPEVGDRRVVFFGFSQGVATISRFIAHSKVPFNDLVLWAGGFAHDVEKSDFDHLTGHEKASTYVSREDPYFDQDFIDKQQQAVMEKMGIKSSLTYYDGGHKVIAELLSSV